jgi:hypothetical protein
VLDWLRELGYDEHIIARLLRDTWHVGLNGQPVVPADEIEDRIGMIDLEDPLPPEQGAASPCISPKRRLFMSANHEQATADTDCNGALVWEASETRDGGIYEVFRCDQCNMRVFVDYLARVCGHGGRFTEFASPARKQRPRRPAVSNT